MPRSSRLRWSVLFSLGCLVGLLPALSGTALARPGVASVEWDGESIYFFRGSTWVRFARSTNTVSDPKPIAGSWDCVKQPVDAAYIGAGSRARKLYFFFGSQWVRYDIGSNKCDTAPKPILGSWPGLPWSSDLDATVAYNGKAYFFKGTSYVRFNIEADAAEGAPIPIAKGWPGVWPDNIEQAINWGDGKVYLFRGAEFVRYDIAKEKADGPAQPIESDPRFAAVEEAFRRGGPSLPPAKIRAVNCTPEQAQEIELAWNNALGTMENVVLPAFLGRDPSKAAIVEAAYRAHFRTTALSLGSTQVRTRFQQILKELAGEHTVACVPQRINRSCPHLAFVLLTGPELTEQENAIIRLHKPIWFCPAFFTDKHAPRRWVTIVHERAHTVGAGGDTYQWSRQYPPAWPDSYDNADSYAFSALHIVEGRRP